MKKLLVVLMLLSSVIALNAQCPIWDATGSVINGTFTVDEGARSNWTPVIKCSNGLPCSLVGATITVPLPVYLQGSIMWSDAYYRVIDANTWWKIDDVFALNPGFSDGHARYDLTISAPGCPNDTKKMFVQIFDVPEEMPPNPPPRGK